MKKFLDRLAAVSIAVVSVLVCSVFAYAQFGPTGKLDLSGTPTLIAATGNTLTVGTQGPQSLRFVTNDTARLTISSTGQMTYGSLSNGQAIGIKSVTASVSGMSGATATATNLIPAGSLVLGCTLRVTTLITASAGTGFTVGDGTTADRWGSAVALALGTTTTGANFKAATAPYQAYPSATSVVLTMTGGNFTAGAVRVTCHYIDFTAATS